MRRGLTLTIIRLEIHSMHFVCDSVDRLSLWERERERESFPLPIVPLKRPTRRTLTSVTISCYKDRHHQWVLMMICDGKQISLVIWRISSTACKLHEVATHYIVHVPIHKFMHAFKFRAMLVWCLDCTSWNPVLQGSSCCVIYKYACPLIVCGL